MYRRITYFNGLNALRFFAALLVILHHGETARKKVDPIWNISWVSLFRDGGIAVEFFFVLSGFLITYLLLKEQDEKGQISIRQFYLKRVLRIWPLYFLVILLATLGLPVGLALLDVGFSLPYRLSEVWYFFVLFLPGLVTFYYGSHILEPTWSIGVEELFYLVWAPVFARWRKHLPTILWAIIALKTALFVIVVDEEAETIWSFLVRIHRLEDMAVGALGAWFIFHRNRPLSDSPWYRKEVQVVVYAWLAVFLVAGKNIPYSWWTWLYKWPALTTLLVDGVFLYLIMGVSLAENSLIKLRSRSLQALGEISYGIYMYHLIIIFLVIRFLKPYLQETGTWAGFMEFYILVIGFTVMVAHLSKTYMENYFLRLKKRWL